MRGGFADGRCGASILRIVETVIAYVFDRPDDNQRAAAGRRRVEAYYGGLWDEAVTHQGHNARTVGLHVWDRSERDCLWPSWQDSGDLRVASLHAPLGYERIVGDVPLHDAPGQLARAVLQAPGRFLDLAPPFTMAVLDPAGERLELFTDSIGVGRLFQLRLPDGWVWSNRPVAALLFAGVMARAAQRGWRYAAACGWFMDDTTPYEGVLVVPGATRIVAEGRQRRRTVSRVEISSVWSGDSVDAADETAEALRDVARSVDHLWPGRPTVDLSGGRDSRVVAAAFLSAGVDLRLNSYDAVPGELQVAEDLVGLLPFQVEHAVTPRTAPAQSPQARPATPALVSRALRWHRYADGLRPASYLFHTPPSSLSIVTHLAIGGAGGELAHGHFYPADVLQLDALPLEPKLAAFVSRLQSRLVTATGPSDEARAAVSAQIEHVLHEAIHGGIENATMLDYFYLVERLRRWGTTGERSGVVSPLLIPSFVRGAFALDPTQRLENALHRDLVRRLVPEWADVPFFKPEPGNRARAKALLRRLADAPDRDLIGELITGSELEGFEPQTIQTLWAASAAGASSAVDEAALRQALWRASFEQHLAEINSHLSPAVRAAARDISVVGTPGPANPRRPSPRPATRGVHPLAQRRLIRRLARHPLWLAFRRTRIGRSWRSLSRPH